VLLSSVSGGKVVAGTTLTRRISTPNVHATKLTFAKDGLVATLYAQPSTSRGPAVLQFSGSGSGDADLGGPLLASRLQSRAWRRGLYDLGDSASATRELVNVAHASGRANGVGEVSPSAGHGVGCRIPNIPAEAEAKVSAGTFLTLGGAPAANSEAAATWPARLRLIAGT